MCVFLLLKNLLHVILGVNRQKAQEWCIKHGFELVELSPEELPEEDGKYFYVWRKHRFWIHMWEIILIQGRRIKVIFKTHYFPLAFWKDVCRIHWCSLLIKWSIYLVLPPILGLLKCLCFLWIEISTLNLSQFPNLLSFLRCQKRRVWPIFINSYKVYVSHFEFLVTWGWIPRDPGGHVSTICTSFGCLKPQIDPQMSPCPWRGNSVLTFLLRYFGPYISFPSFFPFPHSSSHVFSLQLRLC